MLDFLNEMKLKFLTYSALQVQFCSLVSKPWVDIHKSCIKRDVQINWQYIVVEDCKLAFLKVRVNAVWVIIFNLENMIFPVDVVCNKYDLFFQNPLSTDVQNLESLLLRFSKLSEALMAFTSIQLVVKV